VENKKKKTFKEIHNKTRIGMFLKKKAPKLLDIALEVAGSLIPGTSGVADVLQGLIKGNSTGELTKEGILEGSNYIDLEIKKLELDMVEMQELTKRLQSDNEHNLTRLVRPVTYAVAWGILGIITFFDGNIGDFTVDKAYLPMIEDLIKVMTVFYFGSRGVEKVAKEIVKYRNK
jgi:hypothetical protein